MRREGWGWAVKGIMRMIWSIEPYGHGGMGAGDERRREGGRPSLLEILTTILERNMTHEP